LGEVKLALINCAEKGRAEAESTDSRHESDQTKPDHGPTGFEWKTKANIRGLPLVHICFGFKRPGIPMVAKGVIAIGQFGIGVICISQFGIGVLFGLGQFMFSLIAVGQFSIGVLLAAGQFSLAILAIGQFALGHYVICQQGWGTYMWGPDRVDMEAVALFHTIYMKLAGLLGMKSY
jgi:hypothetical protein